MPKTIRRYRLFLGFSVALITLCEGGCQHSAPVTDTELGVLLQGYRGVHAKDVFYVAGFSEASGTLEIVETLDYEQALMRYGENWLCNASEPHKSVAEERVISLYRMPNTNYALLFCINTYEFYHNPQYEYLAIDGRTNSVIRKTTCYTEGNGAGFCVSTGSGVEWHAWNGDMTMLTGGDYVGGSPSPRDGLFLVGVEDGGPVRLVNGEGVPLREGPNPCHGLYRRIAAVGHLYGDWYWSIVWRNWLVKGHVGRLTTFRLQDDQVVIHRGVDAIPIKTVPLP